MKSPETSTEELEASGLLSCKFDSDWQASANSTTNIKMHGAPHNMEEQF